MPPITVTAEDWVSKRVASPLALHLTDLRGAPIGETAQLWEADDTDDSGATRHIRVAYCAQGWWSRSGLAEKPSGTEGCHSSFDRTRWAASGEFDRAGFAEFHRENRVVWAVEIRSGTEARCEAWCDSELPGAWRAIVTAE